MLYTIFKTSYVNGTDWKTEYLFYQGNLGWYVDTKTDSRFCAIEGKRKKAELLGYAYITFPVIYPIELNDGTILHDPKKDIDTLKRTYNYNPIKPKVKKFVPQYKSFVMVEPKHYDTEGEYRCYYCDKKIEGKTLTYDHIYPKSLGFGLKNNKVNACHTCNNYKSNLPPEEFVKHIEFNIEYLTKVKERAMKLISEHKSILINQS